MLSNPILIGALTVLVAIVAVMLSYNANNGLPFTPKYTLHVRIRDASEVTHDAEVHMGGSLVGLVDSIDPSHDAAGNPIAVLNLKLNKNVEPLAVDSTFDVRLKGGIGLKYVAVTPGTSSQTYKDGATVPLTQSGSEVDLDQFLGIFDPKTRIGVQQSTIGFSDALAGRGGDINDAIGAFVPLVTDLGPVARNLASRKTDFGGFFRGLESFSRALAPVAQAQADLYTNLDITFRSLATVAAAAVDLADAADVQHRDRVEPDGAGVPERHGRFVPRSAARVRDAVTERACARECVCDRHEDASGHDQAGRAVAEPRPAPPDLRRDSGRQRRSGPGDAHRPEPEGAARIPDADAVDLQLRDAVPAQHR
jgi:hypothetical protein